MLYSRRVKFHAQRKLFASRRSVPTFLLSFDGKTNLVFHRLVYQIVVSRAISDLISFLFDAIC